MIIRATLDVEFGTCTVTLLLVDAAGKATSLLEVAKPRVEADISTAGLIQACAFIILTCAEQPLVNLGV